MGAAEQAIAHRPADEPGVSSGEGAASDLQRGAHGSRGPVRSWTGLAVAVVSGGTRGVSAQVIS